MTQLSDWHPADDQIADYTQGRLSGSRGAVIAGSIETHLIACAVCRDSVATSVPTQRLTQVWTAVTDRVDAPHRSLVERLLSRLGVSESDARVLLATPTLRLSWLAAIALALTFGVLAARAHHGNDLPFLLIAPLLPVLGVASAFTSRLDPAYPVMRAAPYRTLRMLLVRTVAVLVTTTVLGVIAAIALPKLDLTIAAWLVPALSLTCATLALSTWWEPPRASAFVAIAWVTGVVTTARLSLDPLAAFHAAGQLAVAAAGVAAVIVFVVRHNRVDAWRTS